MRIEKFKCGNEIISIPIAESYKDCIVLAQSDFYRYFGKVKSFWSMLFAVDFKLRFLFWLRMSSYKGWATSICKFMWWRLMRKTGLQISSKTKIGYGLYIGHGLGTIVNSTAKIGNNCNLSQFSTIGTNKGQAAYIGNNVLLSPSVCVVEDVYIGSGAVVGAGAVVVKNVEPNSVVAGVPAKVITAQKKDDFINNKWQFDKVIF